MQEIKTENVYADFSSNKEIVLLRLSQNTMIIQKNIVLGKMKDETGGVAIEESAGLKQTIVKITNSEHKKTKFQS